MAHATVAQLATFLGGESAVPEDAERLLDRASELVDRALVPVIYDPDAPHVLDALSRATCAVVEWWIETGDELGVSAGYADVQIGSVRLANTGPGGKVAQRVAPRAADILIVAGLTPSPRIFP